MSPKFTAVFTDEFWEFFDGNVYSERIAERVLDLVDMLEAFPEAGRVYDPEYIAARPPFSCRVLPVPDSPFVLYYFINEEDGEIVVFSMQFQRADPTRRF